MSACVKCGFENTGAVQMTGNVEYKDKCYVSKCGWADREVDEHLHISCPNCGFVTSAPCADYAVQKERAASTGWRQNVLPAVPAPTSHYRSANVGWQVEG